MRAQLLSCWRSSWSRNVFEWLADYRGKSAPSGPVVHSARWIWLMFVRILSWHLSLQFLHTSSNWVNASFKHSQVVKAKLSILWRAILEDCPLLLWCIGCLCWLSTQWLLNCLPLWFSFCWIPFTEGDWTWVEKALSIVFFMLGSLYRHVMGS